MASNGWLIGREFGGKRLPFSFFLNNLSSRSSSPPAQQQTHRERWLGVRKARASCRNNRRTTSTCPWIRARKTGDPSEEVSERERLGVRTRTPCVVSNAHFSFLVIFFFKSSAEVRKKNELLFHPFPLLTTTTTTTTKPSIVVAGDTADGAGLFSPPMRPPSSGRGRGQANPLASPLDLLSPPVRRAAGETPSTRRTPSSRWGGGREKRETDLAHTAHRHATHASNDLLSPPLSPLSLAAFPHSAYGKPLFNVSTPGGGVGGAGDGTAGGERGWVVGRDDEKS